MAGISTARVRTSKELGQLPVTIFPNRRIVAFANEAQPPVLYFDFFGGQLSHATLSGLRVVVVIQ